ncbi:MAG: hypothetical protein IT258_22120 [Saprospiraceae bacterium]|nr:hypothetical protein [Saprospiraceae bacterium]
MQKFHQLSSRQIKILGMAEFWNTPQRIVGKSGTAFFAAAEPFPHSSNNHLEQTYHQKPKTPHL